MCDRSPTTTQPRSDARAGNRLWLSSLLSHRLTSLALGTAGVAQVALTAAHLGGMPCPFFQLTGIPCPGCGVSRACASLLAGRYTDSVKMHALAPLFLLAIALFLAAGLLPRSAMPRFLNAIRRVETKTALPTMLLAMAIFYWFLRLMYHPVAFSHLIRG